MLTLTTKNKKINLVFRTRKLVDVSNKLKGKNFEDVFFKAISNLDLDALSKIISILSEWVGKSIVALGIAKNYNVNILAIKRDEKMFPMPGGDYVFCEGDHVVVLGANQDVYKIVQFRGKHSKNV